MWGINEKWSCWDGQGRNAIMYHGYSQLFLWSFPRVSKCDVCMYQCNFLIGETYYYSLYFFISQQYICAEQFSQTYHCYSKYNNRSTGPRGDVSTNAGLCTYTTSAFVNWSSGSFALSIMQTFVQGCQRALCPQVNLRRR